MSGMIVFLLFYDLLISEGRKTNNALTRTDQILYCQPHKHVNYYSIVKNGDLYDVVNIDTDPKKPYNEIVDWRRIDIQGLKKMERQQRKNNILAGGQSHITGDQMVVARSAALNSDLQDVIDYIIAQDRKKVKSIFDLVRDARTCSIFDFYDLLISEGRKTESTFNHKPIRRRI